MRASQSRPAGVKSLAGPLPTVSQSASMNGDEAALRAYYERGREQDRLSDPQGDLEFTRTTEILLRALPPAPAVVADIGGGPGRYALWLAGLGYQVEHRDLMPLHVSQLTAAAAGRPGIRTAVADARELDLPDQSVDAVLFLGPLYHLTEQPERVRALREAARVVRPGGPVFAAAISRWAARIDGMLRERFYVKYPAASDVVGEADRTGLLAPLHEGGFPAFCHHPEELSDDLTKAGLEVTDLVSVEGPAYILGDLAERLTDPADRAAALDVARAVERVPELLGFGPHLLATARRPQLVVK
jgi:SAM-dependent methyltransferase